MAYRPPEVLLDLAVAQRRAGTAVAVLIVVERGLGNAGRDQAGQPERLLAARLRVADPHLDRAELVMRADAPPELGRLHHGPGPLQHADELCVAVPVDEGTGNAATGEGAGEDLGAHRV